MNSSTLGQRSSAERIASPAERIASSVTALCAALKVLDADSLSPEECTSLAPVLATATKSLSGASVLVAARAVACGAHKIAGVAEPALWLARAAGTTTAEAKGSLDLAKSLESHEKTKEALLSGEVSVAQAKEVVAISAEFPDLEATLLNAAKKEDLGALRDKARAERLARSDPNTLHDRRHAARHLRHYRDVDGMLVLRGALPPEVGVPFVSRLEREAERIGRRLREEGADPGRFDQRMADALVSLSSGAETERRPVRADIVIVCDLYAWRRGHTHSGDICEVLGAGPIPVSVAKDFFDDAFVKAVLHDGVMIHTVTHFGRHIKAELKTALDLGPVPQFPGRACVDCGRTYGLERDHVDPVAHFGPTSYENLTDRCWPCHHEKTERDRRAGLLGKDPPGPSRTDRRRPTQNPRDG